ncbi:MAG: protein SCO1/2 [Saprospiraceae bacterium]|jgi:protein SCO1/2
MKKELVKGVIIFLMFAISSITAYFILYPAEPLPILKVGDLNPKLVDITVINSTDEHFIGDFTLTNQNGIQVTSKTFDNKIYVANFIFTTCPKMCPLMTSNLNTAYLEFLNDPEVAFISHSVTPVQDSVPVLKAFANKYDVSGNQWHFVTGDKKHIYDLARKNYFAATTTGKGDSHDFIHTENFILVDKNKRIRGIYDGTSFDQIDQLIADINTLKKEH